MRCSVMGNRCSRGDEDQPANRARQRMLDDDIRRISEQETRRISEHESRRISELQACITVTLRTESGDVEAEVSPSADIYKAVSHAIGGELRTPFQVFFGGGMVERSSGSFEDWGVEKGAVLSVTGGGLYPSVQIADNFAEEHGLTHMLATGQSGNGDVDSIFEALVRRMVKAMPPDPPAPWWARKKPPVQEMHFSELPMRHRVPFEFATGAHHEFKVFTVGPALMSGWAIGGLVRHYVYGAADTSRRQTSTETFYGGLEQEHCDIALGDEQVRLRIFTPGRPRAHAVLRAFHGEGWLLCYECDAAEGVSPDGMVTDIAQGLADWYRYIQRNNKLINEDVLLVGLMPPMPQE